MTLFAAFADRTPEAVRERVRAHRPVPGERVREGEGPWRIAAAAADPASLVAELLRRAERVEQRRPRFARPRIAFLCSGQGSQHPGMFATFPPDPAWGAADDERVDRADRSGAALVALAAAQIAAWAAVGVEPDVVLGHSAGELAAHVASGALSPAEAVALAVARGELMASLPDRGAMAVVFAPASALGDPAATGGAGSPLAPGVWVAAENAPGETVIAGSAAGVQAATAALVAAGVRVVPLRIEQASHCPLVDPIVPDLRRLGQATPFRRPRVPWVRNLDGRTSREPPDPEYLAAATRQPVRFAAGVRALREVGVECWVEIGPHPVLVRIAERTAGEGTFLATQDRAEPGELPFLRARAALFERGVP